MQWARPILDVVFDGSADAVDSQLSALLADRYVRLQTRLDEASDALDDAGVLEAAEDDILAFYAFPADHWRKIRSTNPLERFNREIGRRTDVVGIFPDDRSVIRLASMLAIEQAATLNHLGDFTVNLTAWLGERAAARNAQGAEMQRAADRLRAHAAKLAALVDMAEAQHRSVLEHEPELASTSLRHLARLEADCDEAQRVADAAQLQADEFAGEPSIDAALDFFNNIADVIEGKIMKAEGMAELNATLRGLLEAAWLDIDDRKRIAASFRPCVTDAILDGDACHELEFLTHPDYAEKLARIGEQTGRQTFV